MLVISFIYEWGQERPDDKADWTELKIKELSQPLFPASLLPTFFFPFNFRFQVLSG